MEEKQRKFLTKEIIISAIVGLVVGIGLTCLVGFCMDYFAKSAGIAKLRFGNETIATVNGESISTETIYNKLKTSSALTKIIGETDKLILNEMYTLTEKEEKEVEKEANSYIEYYEAQGHTEKEFLTANGFTDREDFLNDLRTSKKSNKYIYDYLEKKLEKGAVEKYYNENKDKIETYDSEHILVKITDTVTDEQALALANEIIGKLNEGKSFAEVVEEYKDKIVHEELGYQGKTASLEQTYIDELVALKDGEYSKTPVKTSYGYHIVHRLSTATLEELRPSIIEKLTEDILEADTNISYKAFVELRKEKNLVIFDEDIKKQYEDYCEELEHPHDHESIS